MLHYWAIRQYDLRDLQARLVAYGLSSLGRSEPHVEATLLLVRSAISAMLGNGWQPPISAGVRIDSGPELLRHRAQELLGPEPVDRVTRIMVTLPYSAATDAALVRELVERGMNIARINCAHDDAAAWRSMAEHVRQATEATGRSCLVAMDLAGPKLRTGPLQPGPRSIKLRPSRNKLGQVITPAQAWLTAAENPITPPEAGMLSLPVSGQWLSRRHDGDVLHLHDTRGSKRRLVLKTGDAISGDAISGASGGFVATADQATSHDRHGSARSRYEGFDTPQRTSPNRTEPCLAPRRHSRADQGLFARSAGHGELSSHRLHAARNLRSRPPG